MTRVSHAAFAALVGLDWADANHDGGLQAAGSATREGLTLEPTPAAIAAWGSTRRTRFTGQPRAVGLERNQGPWVSALRTDDLLVLLPLNPLTWARYRDAFTPSRATDAPTDAALPLDRLRTHRDQLPPLQPQRPTRRALAPRVEHRRRVVNAHVRSTTRLTSTLKPSFPHGLPWFQDQDPHMFCALLRRWPTLNAAHRSRRSTRETFCRDPHGRSADVVAPRLHALQTAPPVTTDEGVIAPHALLVQALGKPLRVTLEAIATVAHAIAQRAQPHPACPRFQALPGAGPVFAPRRLVACGEPRERDAAAAARQP